MNRFDVFKKGCAAMDSGDYEEAARQFWKLFIEMDRLVKLEHFKGDYKKFMEGKEPDLWF